MRHPITPVKIGAAKVLSSSPESFNFGGSFGNLSVMPAKAGIQTWPLLRRPWIPAYAGMTRR